MNKIGFARDRIGRLGRFFHLRSRGGDHCFARIFSPEYWTFASNRPWGKSPGHTLPAHAGCLYRRGNAVWNGRLSSRFAPRQWKETRARLAGVLGARPRARQIKWSKTRPEDVPDNLRRVFIVAVQVTLSLVLAILGCRP